MSLIVIGLNHRSAPVDVREKFAFSEAEVPGVLTRLREQGLAEEAVILSTCNRVELYAASEQEPIDLVSSLTDFLKASRDLKDIAPEHFYQHSDPVSVEHLFKVASGLDSMVLGETEILGQLKKAYDLALQHRFTGKLLNKAFQRAFNVSKLIRTETNIQRGSTSVSAVSVELAEKIFDSLKDKHVLVIGAGDTGEKAARALLSRGARSVTVTNRSPEKAQALAQVLGGKAIGFDQWASVFHCIDIVISSTSAPTYLIDRRKLKELIHGRGSRSLLLIDLAVPRDIDPEANLLDNVFLYNVDDLQTIAEDYLRQRKEEVDRCMKIIRDKAKGLFAGPPRLSGQQASQGAMARRTA